MKCKKVVKGPSDNDRWKSNIGYWISGDGTHESGESTHRIVVAPVAVAHKVLGHLEENAAREVAPEDLGVGGGYLAALGYVARRTHHGQPPVLEVVAGIGRALVVHDGRQREEATEQRLMAVDPAGRLEGVRIEDAHDTEQLIHEGLVCGGKLAEALRRLDDLLAIATLRIRLHRVHQGALLLAEVEDAHGGQDAQRKRIHHVHWLARRRQLLALLAQILRLPALKVRALIVVRLRIGALAAHGQRAAMRAEELLGTQQPMAADACVQLGALARSWPDDQGALPED